MVVEGNKYILYLLNLKKVYGSAGDSLLNEVKINNLSAVLQRKKDIDMNWKMEPTFILNTQRIVDSLHESVGLNFVCDQLTGNSNSEECI